ncbi:unnamed protein product [Clavelina lepadiformis]|uniref:ethanolamine kinase n=1 Tax=Clavelina lepadiformis TaxID=159417 RepID=A0ABP0GK01_CLALP
MRKFLAIAFASDSIIDGGLTVARKNEEQVLRKEVDELESCLTNLNSPIVFCHNDILLHNVIYNEYAEKISFIDYEYAGFNYQAYDIGNHFCEFAASLNEYIKIEHCDSNSTKTCCGVERRNQKRLNESKCTHRASMTLITTCTLAKTFN